MMKSIAQNLVYKVFLLIACCMLGSGLSAQLKFESAKVQKIYQTLPANFKAQIGRTGKEGGSMFLSESMLKGSSLKVLFDSEGRVAHIGYDLFSELINEKYRMASYFVESNLLYFNRLNNGPLITAVTKSENTQLLYNGANISDKVLNPAMLSKLFTAPPALFEVENDRFHVTWEVLNNGSKDKFEMKFPCEVNVVKSMDKGELELMLVRELKSALTISRSNTNQWEKLKSRSEFKKMPLGDLYVQVGDKFGSEDFRSDIYLYKDNNQRDSSKVFTPVFDPKYPRESLQNLFVCNMPSSLHIKIKQVLYGGKREQTDLPLNSFFNYFCEDFTTYFALSKDDGQTIKATVVLYNPIYLYAHMMTISMDKNTFESNDGEIHATMYAYIPHRNFIKDVYVDD